MFGRVVSEICVRTDKVLAPPIPVFLRELIGVLCNRFVFV